MNDNFIIDDKITEEDILYIENWLREAFENNSCDNFYGNINIIKHYFRDGTFLLYRNNGNADGFITYLKFNKVIRIDIICIKPDLRNRGIGKSFVYDYIKYFKKKRNLVVEIDNIVTTEGMNLCVSTDFIKIESHNECRDEILPDFYKLLISKCRKENWSANRRIVLWKRLSVDIDTTMPDASWDLDFENDKTCIFEWAYRDWYIGIIENNQVVEHSKVKYFYNLTDKTHGYIHVTKDIFKKS